MYLYVGSLSINFHTTGVYQAVCVIRMGHKAGLKSITSQEPWISEMV